MQVFASGIFRLVLLNYPTPAVAEGIGRATIMLRMAIFCCWWSLPAVVPVVEITYTPRPSGILHDN